MVYDKVREILSEQLDVDIEIINEDTDIIADLGADSLDVVELMMLLEEEFGLVITDESANEFHTVGDVVNFIEQLV